MAIDFTELDALEATFYDNPGDPVVMGVIADWLDERGFERTAFAYRWGAKRGKWPLTSGGWFFWDGHPDYLGRHHRYIGVTLDNECGIVLQNLGEDAYVGRALPLQLRLATGSLELIAMCAVPHYAYVQFWHNPLRVAMYALGEVLAEQGVVDLNDCPVKGEHTDGD